MKPFPRIHDWYIGRTVLATILAAWAVLVGLDMILALASELGDTGKNGYTLGKAMLYVLYTMPRRLYFLFPTAAVIGALMGLGRLAASSELTVLRAIGLSRLRLGLAVVGAVALLTLAMVGMGETLSLRGERMANAIKASGQSGDMIVAQQSGLWAREGNSFLNAKVGQQRTDGKRQWMELRDVRLYEFDAAGRLESIARAALAEHREGGWQLRNVKRTWFDARSVSQTEALEERWKSEMDDAALAASVARPDTLASAELRRSIDYARRNGVDAGKYEEQYWGRWFYPLNVLALCLAAVPFAFGALRSGGLGKRLFLGIVFAVGFWLLQLMSTKLATVLKFDFRLAYAVPIVVMLAVSAVLFGKRSG